MTRILLEILVGVPKWSGVLAKMRHWSNARNICSTYYQVVVGLFLIVIVFHDLMVSRIDFELDSDDEELLEELGYCPDPP